MTMILVIFLRLCLAERIERAFGFREGIIVNRKTILLLWLALVVSLNWGGQYL